MSKEYNLPKDVIFRANEEAKANGIHPDSVHHICPKSVAKKYHLDHSKIRSDENAIALEQPMHDWIHQTYEEEDYIFLAQALLGIPEEAFEKRRQITEEFHKKKKKRGRYRR